MLMTDPAGFSILDILSEKPSDITELSEKLSADIDKTGETLTALEKSGYIYNKENVYYINKNSFKELSCKIEKYCAEEEEEIYQLDTKKALSEHFFAKRENGFSYAPFEREIAFYESVRSGSLETVKTLFTPLGGEGFGVLCSDELRNLKYHLVISIAMITRFCINGGMTPEEAYSMSDVYIRKTDNCRSHKEINEVHYEMVVAFTKEMRRIRNKCIYSRTVVHMIDYISEHLHEKILITDIAKAVKCSVPYLSRIFHAETGMPVSTYITQKKIEAAANMIQFSNCSALEISNYLHFSSQSYFIKQFKNIIGMTPKEYRNKYYSVGWLTSKIKKEG